jgi:hypothetical protein
VIVPHGQGKKLSPAQEDSGYTVRLVSRLDEQFGDLSDEVAVAIVCVSAQKIGSVQHFASLLKPPGCGLLSALGLALKTLQPAGDREPRRAVQICAGKSACAAKI